MIDSHKIDAAINIAAWGIPIWITFELTRATMNIEKLTRLKRNMLDTSKKISFWVGVVFLTTALISEIQSNIPFTRSN